MRRKSNGRMCRGIGGRPGTRRWAVRAFSPGCDNCYAFALHDQRHLAWKRGRWPAAPAQYHLPFSAVQVLGGQRLEEPLRAKAPRAYFVDSMADLFHEDIDDAVLDDVWAVMAQSPQHVFMILTKRPVRMREYIAGSAEPEQPLSNVWLGVSAEDQARADDRVPVLLETPAAVRFVSAEPLLGPIDLMRANSRGFDNIDWLIIGGESGPHARALNVEWARDLLRQCREYEIAPFVKQLGSHVVHNGISGPGEHWPMSHDQELEALPPPSTANGWRRHLHHGHGGDPEEWPGDLHVREWPAPRE